MSQQRLADLQVLEVAAERVHVGFDHVGATHVFTGHRREHGGRTLYRRALQVVLHRTQAAQFFTATGTTGAAMLELRQRRAVTGGFACAVAIQHQ